MYFYNKLIDGFFIFLIMRILVIVITLKKLILSFTLGKLSY